MKKAVQITRDLHEIRTQRALAEEEAAKARTKYNAERVKLHNQDTWVMIRGVVMKWWWPQWPGLAATFCFEGVMFLLGSE